jgi:uncharacterized membrane protein
MALLIFWALISAMSRSGLNIIDRKQFAHHQRAIPVTLFLNNLFPVILVFCLNAWVWNIPLTQITRTILHPSIFLLALLIQTTAYVFSYALKHHTINQVGIYTKLADLLIPLGFWWFYNNFQFTYLWVSLATTLIAYWALKGRTYTIHTSIYLIPIPLLIVSQALLAPLTGITKNMDVLWLNTLGLMIWRTLFSLAVLLWNRPTKTSIASHFSKLSFLRSILTITTQYGFVVAVSSINSVVVWPILNSSILLSSCLSAIFLKEKPHPKEWVAIISITLLVLIG